VKHLERPSSSTPFSSKLVELHAPGHNISASATALGPLVAREIDIEPGGGPAVDAARSGYAPGVTLNLDHFAWSIARRVTVLYPPVGGHGIVVLAEDDGTISASDVRDGRVLWQDRLTEPALTPPVLAWPLVFAADANRSLFALDARTGATRWAVALPDQVASAPTVADGRVYVVDEDSTVRALDAADGSQLWVTDLPSLVIAPPVLAGPNVVVVDQTGGVSAFSRGDGSSAWEASLDTPLETGPVGGSGTVVATDQSGAVYAFDADDGALRWKVTPGSYTSVNPSIAGSSLILAAAHALERRDLATGALKWRTHLHGEAGDPPLVLGDTVVLEYGDSRLERFALGDGASLGVTAVRGPDRTSTYYTDIGLAYVGGALVVPQHDLGPWPFTWLLAYPATRAGTPSGPPGVRLAGEIRATPSLPLQRPHLVGTTLVMASLGNDAWAVPASGPPIRLVHSRQTSPFAIPAGDAILVQDGRHLLSVPLEGGEPRWRFPMGDPQLESAPAVVGDIAVVPERTEGLAGADLRTGKILWAKPQKGLLGYTAPLPLPNGEVAYASGGLTIRDARTGAARVTVPGIEAPGPIAADGGVIFAQAFTNGSSPALIAFDARSGKRLWSVPMNIGAFIGPAAADGVVVAADAGGVVTGYEGRTGREVWRLPLQSTLGASPVIVGDRVVIYERGETEDLNQRDNRLTILDVRTGRFLTSFEYVSLQLLYGGLGADRGIILAPANLIGTSVLLLRMEER
jgi:outer membrane protein assembly factor BamB